MSVQIGSIRELNLRARRGLIAGGCEFLDEAVALSDEQLLGFEGVGHQTIARLRAMAAVAPPTAPPNHAPVPDSPRRREEIFYSARMLLLEMVRLKRTVDASMVDLAVASAQRLVDEAYKA